MSHQILGSRGKILNPESVVKQVEEWARAQGAEVLVVDARAVFGRDHLESAILHAERAKATKTMTARTLSLETLLYVSGQRQIVDAIRVAGLRKGTEAIGIVAWDIENPDELVKCLGWTRDDRVLDAVGKSLEVLGITEQDQGTLPPTRAADLALEKVALLDLAK